MDDPALQLTEMSSVPGKPRGKMTAYAFFVHTCRQELKNSRPNQNVVFGEFSKKCAAKWKELEPHNKKPFEDMAARDKIRYQNEVDMLNRQHANNQNQHQQFIQTTGPNGETIQQIVIQQPSGPGPSGSGMQQHHQQPAAPPPSNPRRKKNPQPKDPNAPKRPHSAFLLYCSDHRPVVKEQYPGARIGDIAKKLAAGWANLDPQVKAHYEEASNKQKERYKREKEEYIKKKQQMALEAQQQQQQQQQLQQQQVQHNQHQSHSPVAVSGHQVIHQHVQHHQQEQMQPQTVIIQPHGGGSPQAVQIKEWINQPGQLQTHRAIIQPNGGTPQTITIIQNPNGQISSLPANTQRQHIIRQVQPQQNHIQHIQRHEPQQHRGGHQQMKTIQRVQPHNLSHPTGSTIQKPKKVKQIKDPNAPKRPHSAFLLYCADHRHALRQKYPGARIGDIAKKLGQGWANVDQPTKMHYEGLSNQQKDRYKREKEEYKASFNRPATQISPYTNHGPSSSSNQQNQGPSNSGQPGQEGPSSIQNQGHNEMHQEIRVPQNTQIVEVDGRSHIAIMQEPGAQMEERSHSEASGSFVQQGGTQIVQIAKSEAGGFKQEIVQEVQQ